MAFAAGASPAIAACVSAFSPPLPSARHHHFHHSYQIIRTTVLAYSARRFRGVNPSSNRLRSKPAPAPAPDDGLRALEAELWRLRRRVELRLHRLAASADEAYRDLRSAVREVGGDRVVLTFRRSSLRFAIATLLWSLALSAAAWALLGFAFRAWQRRWLGRGWWGGGAVGSVVRRRDRSLGGKEVVVAVKSGSAAPVSRRPEPAKEVRRRETHARVPGWWPEMETEVGEPKPEMEKWARLANRLVRGGCLYISLVPVWNYAYLLL